MAGGCWHIVQEGAGGILSSEVCESQPEGNLPTGFSQIWLPPSVDLLCDLKNRRYSMLAPPTRSRCDHLG